MRPWAAVGLNVAGWTAVHVASGYAAHRLPLERLEHDGWLLRIRRWEDGGRAYRRLGVTRWKHRLPEAGAFFAGGTSKRSLPAGERRQAIERFAAETRRAELAHWWAMAATPLFALWNPPLGMLGCAAYAVAANVPCIVVQRYNRARAARVRRFVAARSSASGAASRAARRASDPGTSGSSIP